MPHTVIVERGRKVLSGGAFKGGLN